ncbi:LEAF RUST 10 DISEASE-RESISTANCE LOCUS RECEPTOR-LIKE PROTEIN KINASE 1.2 [Trifolium repens]|nr:LEAF RUST 10 DISEASE-RESISTANCE LOCUS RECEPTOR-LIKE PROTEIN KINASE 1.2 [Trifolium repens]
MFRKGLVYDNCSSALTNTSLDLRHFQYMPNVKNITILYNCPNDLKFVNGTSVNSFLCKEDEKKRAFYADSALAEGIKCDGVRIEVQVTQEVELGGGIEGLNKALSSGFDVKYSSYTQECLKCILSNGTCGGNDRSQFSCYCPDGTEGLDCSHLHDNGWNWKKKFGVGVAVAAVASAIFVGIGFYIYYGRKKKKNIHTVSSTVLSRSISSSSSENSENGSRYHGVHFFTYSELEKATNYFDSTTALGDGGFGTVYFGKLRDGRLVAVKRMNENNYRRVEQFVNEVEILTGLHHQNLVSLYGCTSRHSRELLLVYEYVPNGTVADHLHGKKAKPGMLPWHIRMNIAIETASALVYLHATDIIHRDVKTTNILLDSHFSVKVGDFGLSRLFPIHVTHISTAPQGTPGYVDPEYHLYYQLTDKSDVFSFGVVLIELISSMPAVDILRNKQEINLSNMAIKKIQNGTLHELVDPTLGFESNFKVRKMINAVAELAFQCLQSSKDVRPSMVEVLERLKDIQSDDGTYKCKPEVLDISVDDDITLIKNDPPPSSPDSNIIIFP